MKTSFLFQARALIVAAFLPVLASAASELPSTLLQKGIYAEEIERNLDSAIKIYEQIAAEAATNRAVVAQAQYRLAVCYQKKGNKEQAIKLLNELVEQSPADLGLSKKAREILVELGVTPPEAVSVRRIPLSNAGYIVAVSPDGRFAAYQPRDSNELFVQDLINGKTLPVAKDADMEGHSPPARFSPDGQWIAYDYQEAGIHIAKTDGTEIRKLLAGTRNDGSKHWNEVVGWSADGTQVIMAQWDYTPNSRNCRIAVALNAKTGVATEIAPAANYRGPDQWNISDDGRYVARRGGEYPKAITLLDFKTGHEETVLDRDADRVIGWVSGDSKLVYTKSGIHGVEIWAVDVQDGKPVDEPRLVSSDSVKNFSRASRHAYPLGVTRDGRIFYTVEREKPAPAELWVLEGFLPSKSSKMEPTFRGTEIPPNELIVGADHSFLDKKTGLSATLPLDWKISAATRQPNGASFIRLGVAGAKNTSLTILCNPITQWPQWSKTKKPASGLEEDAWLRERAESNAQSAEQNLKDFKRDSAGATLRLVGGRRAVSWSASFKQNEVTSTWLVLHVYSGNTYAQIVLRAPSAALEVTRPAYESFVESLRLP